MRRAQSSVALNVAEGMYSRGRNQRSRFHTALGSARESLACAEVAVTLGYVSAVNQDVIARFNRSIGSLAKLAGPG